MFNDKILTRDDLIDIQELKQFLSQYFKMMDLGLEMVFFFLVMIVSVIAGLLSLMPNLINILFSAFSIASLVIRSQGSILTCLFFLPLLLNVTAGINVQTMY